MNAHVTELTQSQKSAEAVAAIVAGKSIPLPEKSRHLWLAASLLVQMAKEAEHAAFLAMREIETNNSLSALDFHTALLKHLGDVKAQLVFMGGVVNG